MNVNLNNVNSPVQAIQNAPVAAVDNARSVSSGNSLNSAPPLTVSEKTELVVGEIPSDADLSRTDALGKLISSLFNLPAPKTRDSMQ